MMTNPHVVSRTLTMALLAACLLTMTGCFILPMEPKDKGLATDQYKVEMEFLPQAQMVKEETTPHWDLGRRAFKPGEDRIIVIGRTTSYADKDEDGKPIDGTMRPRKLERVWINIRPDIPLGKAQKLEDLETVFLIGYDVNNLDEKGFFNGPALTKGFVNLIEEGPDKVVVILDMEVRPNRPFQAENWFLQGQFTIDVVPDGRIATKAVSRDVQVAEHQLTPGPGANPAADLTTPVVAPTLPVAGNGDAPDSSGTTEVKTEPAPVATNSLVGSWAYNTPGMDYRFQFGANGKFIFSGTRGDGVRDAFDPAMCYGTWEIKRSRTTEWLVMLVDQAYFGNGPSVLNDFHRDDKSIMLKVEWNGSRPILTGDVPMARAKQPIRYLLEPGGYPDMNKVLPPFGRNRNAPAVENKKPYW